jgi:hypothetical protein
MTWRAGDFARAAATWPLYLAALLPAHLFLRNPANGFSIALEYFAANAIGALVTAGVLRQLIGDQPRLALQAIQQAGVRAALGRPTGEPPAQD